MTEVAQTVVIVGNPGTVHVGAHLQNAAIELGYNVVFCNSNDAYLGNWFLAKMSWHALGHRPLRLNNFSERVVAACRATRPAYLITTGIAPVTSQALMTIRDLGVQRMNYLTDDPWNSAHQARWFLRGLPSYDSVFSPRRSLLDQLRSIGCAQVSFLPFAYSPGVHHPEPPATSEERARFDFDIVFAGGADADRMPYITALIGDGFKIGLYGGYWKRFPETREHALGHADPALIRKAIGGAKVSLCLVRRANRDGSSMRSFEVAATGACMLTEDTEEHREIFGQDLETVVYFSSIPEMLTKLRWLLQDEKERTRLACAARERILSGRHTYRDRLTSMLGIDGAN